MTQEEKQLLLKDLCARLPFHVKVAIDFKGYLEVLPSDEDLEYTYRKNLNFILDYEKKTIEDISLEPNILYAYPCSERFQMLKGYTYELDYGVPVEFIKPYLRPMSSMSEEEKADLEAYSKQELDKYADNVLNHADKDIIRIYQIALIYKDIDWYNKNHFDYRGLIPMNLALEAPKDMYKLD